MRVLGLDVSANRIAWAAVGGKGYQTGCVARKRMSFTVFVDDATDRMLREIPHGSITAACIEINLHPKITYKGHPSANMIRAYMRSRWVEGAVLAMMSEEEPREIVRTKGGGYKVPPGTMYALQASGRSRDDEKADRRRRMSMIYSCTESLSQDEIDAMAIAHECLVALQSGIRVEK